MIDSKGKKLLMGIVLIFGAVYGGVLYLTSTLTESAQFAADGASANTAASAEAAVTLSAETKALEDALKGDPDNRELMKKLAVAYADDAAKARNVGWLIRAVDLYQSVLKADPADTGAALSLALIMMDIGGYDRAAELFGGYLKVKPDDVRVRGDYAPALIQSERLDDAEKQLQLIIDSKQYLVQSYLSRALIMKLRGSKDRVFVELDAAASHAENDTDREKIAGFRAMLNSAEAAKSDAPKVADKPASPAEAISQYFKSHPIIGPKLQGIRWPSEKVAEVLVKEFPVEQMPPFARARFVKSVTELLAGVGEGFKVVLIDVDSGKELIAIP